MFLETGCNCQARGPGAHDYGPVNELGVYLDPIVFMARTHLGKRAKKEEKAEKQSKKRKKSNNFFREWWFLCV